MKSDHNIKSSVIASKGVSESTAFSIAKGPHLFNILSNGLYADKITAVLREIGCNAQDAHVIAGKAAVPFEVKLPNEIDKSFHVKDFGPGLSDYDLRNLYTTYGWSSKQGENTTTGMFGLGSKAPFAYTLQNAEERDGFTIQSAFDGFKRIYTCHISETGVPAISMLYEGPADADWPSGLMVSFPVRFRDFKEFSLKAQEVFQWFEVPPIILGGNQVEKPEFDYIGTFFSIGCSPGTFVTMGNVKYPVDCKQLDLENTWLDSIIRNSGVTLHLSLGEVMVTPSRETLEYTPKTKEVLRKRLLSLMEEVAGQLLGKLTDTSVAPWDRLLGTSEFMKFLPDYRVRASINAFFKDNLPDYAENSTFNKEELDALATQSVIVPSWLGAGDLPALGQRQAAVITAAGTVTGADIVEARVLGSTQTMNGTLKVFTKKITRGLILSASSASVARVVVSSNVAVIYEDSPYGLDSVKAALVAKRFEAVVFLRTRLKGDNHLAKALADKLASEGLFKGLPVFSTSALDVVIKKKPASKRGIAATAQLVDFEMTTIKTNSVDTAEIKNLSDWGTSEKFYIEANDRGYTAQVSNTLGAEKLDAAGSLRTVVSRMSRVMRCFDINLSEVAVAKGRREGKRLEAVGFKPLLFKLRELLTSQKGKELRFDVLNCAPKVDLDKEPNFSTTSFALDMARHVHQRTEFWLCLKNAMPDSAIIEVLENFAKEIHTGLDDELLARNNAVTLCCSYTRVYEDASDKPTYFENRQSEVNKAFNPLKLLDAYNLKKASETSPRETAHLLARLYQTTPVMVLKKAA